VGGFYRRGWWLRSKIDLEGEEGKEKLWFCGDMLGEGMREVGKKMRNMALTEL
jgi:hypothetical protein